MRTSPLTQSRMAYEEESVLHSKSKSDHLSLIRKEFVALARNHVRAVILNQFLYYFLIDRGWVQTRLNPQNKWTGGRQYRVNLRKLNYDLQKKGYSLPYGREIS